jgi:hypothetical protein
MKITLKDSAFAETVGTAMVQGEGVFGPPLVTWNGRAFSLTLGPWGTTTYQEVGSFAVTQLPFDAVTQ